MEGKTCKVQKLDLLNPSLKTYFDHKLNGAVAVIYYSKQNIQNIVENDLFINMATFSPYIKEVISEALPYYLDNWSGWIKLKKTSLSIEEEYIKFLNEMRKKILELQKMEQYYLNKFDKENENRILTYNFELPEQIEKNLVKLSGKNKKKLPYTLQLKGSVEHLHEIVFENHSNNDLQISNHSIQTSYCHFTYMQILNLPFASAILELPGIMTLKRKNPFQVHRFLCNKSDTWKFVSRRNAVSVRNCSKCTSHTTRPPIVLTVHFFSTFIRKLINVILGYNNLENVNPLHDVLTFLYEFLSIVKMVKLPCNTIGEAKRIKFNLSKTKYFNDICKDNDNCDPKDVLVRMISTPFIEMCLHHINLSKDPVTGKDFSYFNFESLDVTAQGTAELSEKQKEFIEHLNSCMKYKCLMCNSSFQTITMFGIHVQISHPVPNEYFCTKCFNKFDSSLLLTNQWKHKCSRT